MRPWNETRLYVGDLRYTTLGKSLTSFDPKCFLEEKGIFGFPETEVISWSSLQL